MDSKKNNRQYYLFPAAVIHCVTHSSNCYRDSDVNYTNNMIRVYAIVIIVFILKIMTDIINSPHIISQLHNIAYCYTLWLCTIAMHYIVIHYTLSSAWRDILVRACIVNTMRISKAPPHAIMAVAP